MEGGQKGRVMLQDPVKRCADIGRTEVGHSGTGGELRERRYMLGGEGEIMLSFNREWKIMRG